MPTTTKLALPYPALSAAPNVPQDLQSLAQAVDTAAAAAAVWCRKTGDTPRATTVTSAADPDLLVSLAAGNYWVHGLILYTADAAVDMRTGLYGPSGAAFFGTFRGAPSSVSADPTTILVGPPGINTAPAGAGFVIGGLGTGTFLTIDIQGLLTLSTGGTVGFAWAQSASSSTATTVRAGSTLIFSRLP
jgi:hypothetical protein